MLENEELTLTATEAICRETVHNFLLLAALRNTVYFYLNIVYEILPVVYEQKLTREQLTLHNPSCRLRRLYDIQRTISYLSIALCRRSSKILPAFRNTSSLGNLTLPGYQQNKQRRTCSRDLPRRGFASKLSCCRPCYERRTKVIDNNLISLCATASPCAQTPTCS